jgi:hypothetical protein
LNLKREKRLHLREKRQLFEKGADGHKARLDVLESGMSLLCDIIFTGRLRIL